MRAGSTVPILVLVLVAVVSAPPARTLGQERPAVIDLGTRRELFVDGFLIEKLDRAEQRLHHPTPQGLAITHDQPWEGSSSGYHTVFRDGDRYRMYYRGAQAGAARRNPAAEVVCYAESADGILWSKPLLGLVEFDGDTANNIVWNGVGSHNFTPFKDPNPACPPEARYKALGRGEGGLYAFQSADGLRWAPLHDQAVITKGHFDSQNLAFYDHARGCYVEYHRAFTRKIRAVLTCTSADFILWTEPEWIAFTDVRTEHLYTNQIQPYPRAPHLYLGFPMRFMPDRNPTGNRTSGVSDVVFMTSRDGLTFDRWGEAFLRPGPQRERWVHRNNGVALGLVETKSAIAGVPDELSFYSIEGYAQGEACRLRRYTLRPDGFVSINAPLSGGTLLTRPIRFDRPAKGVASAPRSTRSAPIRLETARPIRGGKSLTFHSPGILTLGGTQDLGEQATLAAAVRNVPKGHRRLFSAYDGGPTVPGKLVFDFNSGAPFAKQGRMSIRFRYDDTLVVAPFDLVGNWSGQRDSTTVHHLAATWDRGSIKLYFDGELVGAGQSAKQRLVFSPGDLRLGEDYPPARLNNEPFKGTVDDILVLRRALSAEEVKQLAETGPEGVVDPDVDEGVLFDLDHPLSIYSDGLPKDGSQHLTGSIDDQPAEVELRLNFATSGAGSIRCEIQDEAGRPLEGYSLEDCDELYGDSLDHPVRWKGVSEVRSLAGRPIRLLFELRDADLFALRFGR